GSITGVVHELGDPCRECLVVPDVPQAGLRIAVQPTRIAVANLLEDGSTEYLGVVESKVNSLGAHGGNDVRGVSEQVQLAVAHRRVDLAPQGYEALVDDRAARDGGAETRFQFAPDARVRPLRQGLIGRALQIDAAGVRTTGDHAGETTGVDGHAGRGGRDLGQ